MRMQHRTNAKNELPISTCIRFESKLNIPYARSSSI